MKRIFLLFFLSAIIGIGATGQNYLNRAQDTESRKWGFVNAAGEWIIPPQFDGVDGPTCFDNDGSVDYAAVLYRGKWGAVDRTGQWIVQPVHVAGFRAASAAHQVMQGRPRQQTPTTMQPPVTQKRPVAQAGQTPPQQSQPASAGQGQAGTQSGTPVGVAADIKAPTLTVLSPRDGGTYDRQEVAIRYDAKTFDGTEPQIEVRINREPYDIKTKGVKRVGTEIELILPVRQEKCDIQIIARDGRGLPSEPVWLTLYYNGHKQKPALHLLAVGVSRYDDPSIIDLDHAAKDAEDMVATIRALPKEPYGDFPEPILLTDGEATVRNLKAALRELRNRTQQGDVVLVYLSGHGAQEDNRTYFITSDADREDLFSTAMSFDDIQHAMNIMLDKQCKVLTFMDACHSGAGYKIKSLSTLEFADPKIISFYSSTGGQQSQEGDKWGNGVFTRVLIDGLKGEAADGNGRITVAELERHIKQRVPQETNYTQTPLVRNELGGDYILF